jgi:alpha-mannosidase
MLLFVFCLFVQAVHGLPCDLTGDWFYDTVTVLRVNRATDTNYHVSCVHSNCGWTIAAVTQEGFELVMSFDNGVAMAAVVSTDCNRLLWARGTGLPSSKLWCRVGLPADSCVETTINQTFWLPGKVHYLPVSHSDIGWLGLQDDLQINRDYISMALDLMRQNDDFKWQHECMLFLRVWLEKFPEREAELVQRIKEGRFDIGGTFTEGYESTMPNEVLVRQVYQGRKWFVDRWPELADIGAQVAFHQDGPLRSLQTAQVFAKSGIKYLKFSRFSDRLFRWKSPDGSSLLSFGQVHYCEGEGIQMPFKVTDVKSMMSYFEPQFQAHQLPPQFPFTDGCDYQAPQYQNGPFNDWNSLSNVPRIEYSLFSTFFKSVESVSDIEVVQGEKPNLWLYEACPPHHKMFEIFREAGRLLPIAEALWSWHSVLVDSPTKYPAQVLNDAWRNITLDDHGLAGEDVPFGDNLPSWIVNSNSPKHWDLLYLDKWNSSKTAAENLIHSAITQISSYIGSLDEHLLVVFNHLSWNRNAVIEIDSSLILKDENGEIVPAQVSSRSPNQASVFVENVPSMGYRAYKVKQVQRNADDQGTRKQWTSMYENKFYRITPGKGGIKSVFDIEFGVELFDTSYFMVGEWMQLEYIGPGASETHEYPHPVSSNSFQRLGNLSVDMPWFIVEDGPLKTVFTTDFIRTNHSDVQLEFTAYKTLKQLDLRVHIANWDSAFGAVNRIVFPLKSSLRNVSYAVPFGVVQVGVDEAEETVRDVWITNPGPENQKFERGWKMRPREIQEWIRSEVSENVGVTISSGNVGVWDWTDATGTYPKDQTVLAPEMLMHTNSNRGPFLPEPGNHSYTFSIFSTPSGWRSGWKQGVEAMNPFSVVGRPAGNTVARSGEDNFLGVSSSFLKVSEQNARVSTVKLQEVNSNPKLIVRAYDVTGQNSNVSFSFCFDAQHSLRTNMIEQETSDMLETSGNIVNVPISPWSIETFLVIPRKFA